MLFKTLCKGSNNNLIMQLFMQKIKPQAILSGAMGGYKWGPILYPLGPYMEKALIP